MANNMLSLRVCGFYRLEIVNFIVVAQVTKHPKPQNHLADYFTMLFFIIKDGWDWLIVQFS